MPADNDPTATMVMGMIGMAAYEKHQESIKSPVIGPVESAKLSELCSLGSEDIPDELAGEVPEREYKAAAVYTIRYINTFPVWADSIEEAQKEAEDLEPNMEWQDFLENNKITKTQVFITKTPDKGVIADGNSDQSHEPASADPDSDQA
ncbi:MAG: hypothetical protein AB9866_21465 [Syntrophobacteraceae bacterium]